MQNGNSVEIGLLNEGDLGAATQLERQLAWNQTETDWRRLLRLEPRGCFAARVDRRLIGTVTAVAYGTEVAWIGMMLVDPAYRRQGIATRLMNTTRDYLKSAGVKTVKLDATADGRPLYERIGFVPETLIERWEGVARPAPTSEVEPFNERSRSAVYALDRLAFGASRAAVLDSLMTDSHILPMMTTGKLRGYALARPGARAFYVGPVVATDGGVGPELLDSMLSRLAGERVYLDYHTGFGMSSTDLAGRGFVRQRVLVRMRDGQESAAGTSNLVLAIAGPELG